MTARTIADARPAPGAERAKDDAVMINAVRRGEMGAWVGLYRNHVAAAYHLARQLGRCRADADDLVSEAFVRVLGAIRDGRGPHSAFRAYLFTALRHVAYDKTRRDRKTELTGDVLTVTGVPVEAISEPFQDTALADLDRMLAAKAFARLPERWQSVLRHIEIEGKTPAEVAALVGLTANGVSALAYRAREGLRRAYLQAHMTEPVADCCQATAGKLGAWVRNGLAKRDTPMFTEHLTSCARCQRLAADLVEAGDGLAHADATRYLATVAAPTAPTGNRFGRATSSSARSAPRSRDSWPPCVSVGAVRSGRTTSNPSEYPS